MRGYLIPGGVYCPPGDLPQQGVQFGSLGFCRKSTTLSSFSKQVHNWVIEIIRTISYSLLMNEKINWCFHGKCGVRHKDPFPSLRITRGAVSNVISFNTFSILGVNNSPS